VSAARFEPAIIATPDTTCSSIRLRSWAGKNRQVPRLEDGGLAVLPFTLYLYQPTATSSVIGFEQPMSLEYPPASLYGKAYCCILMAWASIH